MVVRPLLAFLVALLIGVTASAQDLLRLAPDAAIVALEIAEDAGPPPGLVQALDDLGWPEAMATWSRLAAALGTELDDAADGTDMLGLSELAVELEATCGPGFPAVSDLVFRDLVGEGLATFVLSPVAPVPQVLAIARPRDPAAASDLYQALVDCFGDLQLEQDGVALHVLFDGSDQPLVVARVDDLFVAATDPNLVRGVVRRALGASEPSLADAPLGRALAGVAPGGLGFGIDAAGIGAVLAALSGTMPPEATDLVERAVALLETLGVIAGRAGWAEDGLRFELHHAVPSPAPDATLADLLLDPRPAGPPPWLPPGSVGVNSTVVPLRGIVDYLDGWLLALEEPLGMRADVHGLAADFLGLDLDAALLAWAGETVHVIDLEAPGADVRYWLLGAPRIFAVPVLNEELARDGLEELGAGMLRLVGAIADLGAELAADPFADPFAPGVAPPRDPAFEALFGPDAVVVTREVVHGLEVERVRTGPTLDLAVALFDGHLVVATPYRALHALLDARATGVMAPAAGALASALAGLPAAARRHQVIDLPAFLHGFADLTDLAAQPLASALAVAAQEGVWDGLVGDPFAGSFGDFDDTGFFGAFDDDALTPPSFGSSLPWGVDLDELIPIPLELGDTREGTFAGDELHRRFELFGVTPGTTVQVEMNDLVGTIDTYLYVFDGDTGEVLFENDDAPGLDRSFVAFIAEPGINYHVLATSWSGFDQGTYRVSVRAADDGPGDAPPPVEADAVDEVPAAIVDAPTFAELLAATDLLPRTLRTLADRSGFVTRSTTVEGDVIITRGFWPLR